ncbi:MAG: hypothetical protein Q7V62_01915 [Actinomycetota bacterium]|nr:hypothetical protein [Actinomycetota bacterium]
MFNWRFLFFGLPLAYVVGHPRHASRFHYEVCLLVACAITQSGELCALATSVVPVFAMHWTGAAAWMRTLYAAWSVASAAVAHTYIEDTQCRDIGTAVRVACHAGAGAALLCPRVTSCEPFMYAFWCVVCGTFAALDATFAGDNWPLLAPFAMTMALCLCPATRVMPRADYIPHGLLPGDESESSDADTEIELEAL